MVRTHHRLSSAVVLAGLVVATLCSTRPSPVTAEPLPTTAFQVVAPQRLADTRDAVCTCTVVDASTIRVVVAGRDGVAADIAAAALTITAVAPTAVGFVTVFPTGQARPGTSTLNLTAGATTSNSTIVPVGDGGAIDLYFSVATQLAVDITGGFTAADTATAGRFHPTAPARLRDTRDGGSAPLGLGESITVPLPGDVPADAIALAVNVTSVKAAHSGFLTGYAAGSEPPTTSFMNPDGSGAARAASTILPISADGLTISTTAGGHIVVDLVGWFTGPSADDSADGLYVPVPAGRLLDTRSAGSRLWAGGTRELAAPVLPAAAVVTNLTMILPDRSGFVTAFPAGTTRPATSSVNAPFRNAITPNLAITTLSDRGTAYFSSGGSDLLVDLMGYFTGTPVTATQPVPSNTAPKPRVLMVGDSTLYGLTEVPRTQGALRGFTPVLDAKPCRRLVVTSCKSHFTLQIPNMAIEAIAAAPGTYDIVVIKTGYNDTAPGFDVAIAKIVAGARAKGARLVLWLTYSESTKAGRYDAQNAALRAAAASPAFPDLVVADWRAYASKSVGWYASDRLHLMTLGNWATSDYISRWVAATSQLPCPVPWTVGGSIAPRCPSPDAYAAATGTTPALKSLYGT